MVVHHRMGQWRLSEANHDKLRLGDSLRVRMGKRVVRYFEGEMQREGGPIWQY